MRHFARKPRTFRDRADAGRALADELARVVTPPCVVAAIPRGGVVVALPIAERLGAPLTVVYARKLTAPVAPELAFGVLDEDGEVILDEGTVRTLGLGPDAVDEAKRRVAGEIRRRMALYRVPPLAGYLPGAAVVLVDDGLATGLTMRAAVAYARRHRAPKVVVATPCASVEAAERFRREADQLVCPVVDEDFMAVGAYYRDFSPVPDELVTEMLERARALTAGATASPVPTAPLRLSLKNSRGLRLAAQVLMPASPGPHPVVVFAHGRGSGKDSPRNRAVAEALCAAGVAALLFDLTGHGESEGTREESTLDQHVDDLRAAVEIAGTLDDLDARRLGIAGASSGAAAALRLAAESPHVRALVLRSANAEGAEDAARRVGVPTLLVVGERDEATRAANETLLERLAGPRRLEIVPRGDRLFEDREALGQAVALTVSWFGRHLRRTGG